MVISQDKERILLDKMKHFDISEQDIIEKFIRSHGPGGQNVNKTSTCVYLKHVPTGIEVKYQRERSQVLNRYLARKLLLAKIEDFIKKKRLKEKQCIEKIRRQKRKRSARAKLKILEDKRRHSDKKKMRLRVSENE